MTHTTFLLVLLAALLHASWNLLAKKSGGGAAFVLLGNVVVMMLYTPMFLLWWRHSPSLVADVTQMQRLFIAISAAVHLVYSLTLQRGYQLADYGVVYPARGQQVAYGLPRRNDSCKFGPNGSRDAHWRACTHRLASRVSGDDLRFEPFVSNLKGAQVCFKFF